MLKLQPAPSPTLVMHHRFYFPMVHNRVRPGGSACFPKLGIQAENAYLNESLHQLNHGRSRYRKLYLGPQRPLNNAMGYCHSHSNGRGNNMATSNFKMCGEAWVLTNRSSKIFVGVLIITIWGLLKFRSANTRCQVLEFPKMIVPYSF